MLTAFVVALVLAPPSDVPVIVPEQARAYAGHEVIVQGRVTQVNASKDGRALFFNFGGRYPDQAFNAVIFEPKLPLFPETRSLEGKIVSVRGKVQLYKGGGKAEMILERPEQVTIDSSTAAALDTVPGGHSILPAPGSLPIDPEPPKQQTNKQREQQPATSPRTAPLPMGENLGGLYFDPQGADFTLWVQRFRDEVYRNWIMPQAAYFKFRGHVDFELTVERNGSISALRMQKSSGTPAFDKAAQDAITSGRFLNLPEDYHPARITMKVTFFYNEAPLR